MKIESLYSSGREPLYRPDVVIPVLNEREMLPGFLTRIQALGLPLNLFFVDNGSEDGTVEFRSDRPDVTLIAQGTNLGYGRFLADGLTAPPGRPGKFEEGGYVAFYHFQEPETPLRSLPGRDLRLTASRNNENAYMMRNRDVLTGWEGPESPGEWVQADLGRLRTVGRVSFLVGNGQEDYRLIRLEISRDGKNWQRVTEDRKIMVGLVWKNGRPRLDDHPRIQIHIPPREARYLPPNMPL